MKWGGNEQWTLKGGQTFNYVRHGTRCSHSKVNTTQVVQVEPPVLNHRTGDLSLTWCWEIELVTYLWPLTRGVKVLRHRTGDLSHNFVMDLRITHEHWRSSSNPVLYGHLHRLHYPLDVVIDKLEHRVRNGKAKTSGTKIQQRWISRTPHFTWVPLEENKTWVRQGWSGQNLLLFWWHMFEWLLIYTDTSWHTPLPSHPLRNWQADFTTVSIWGVDSFGFVLFVISFIYIIFDTILYRTVFILLVIYSILCWWGYPLYTPLTLTLDGGLLKHVCSSWVYSLFELFSSTENQKKYKERKEK